MTVTRTVWGFIEQRDHRLMRRMNRWRAPRWIRYWVIAGTRLGGGWVWYSLAGLFLIFCGAARQSAGWGSARWPPAFCVGGGLLFIVVSTQTVPARRDTTAY